VCCPEVVAVTASTASSDGLKLFDSPFNIGATVVGVLCVLFSVVFIWTGYQESALPVVGTEMSLLLGIVGFMLALFIAVVAFVMAAFMDSGFGE